MRSFPYSVFARTSLGSEKGRSVGKTGQEVAEHIRQEALYHSSFGLTEPTGTGCRNLGNIYPLSALNKLYFEMVVQRTSLAFPHLYINKYKNQISFLCIQNSNQGLLFFF